MSAAENIDTEEVSAVIAPPTDRDYIKACLLFADAGDDVVDFVASKMETVSFSKDEPVILQGEANDHVYFIKMGAIEIVNYRPEGNRIHRLALLKAGAHFAEFSVLNKSTKSSSAYAYEDCELFRMTGANFLQMLTRFPKICTKLTIMVAELNHRIEASNEFIPYFTPSKFRGVGAMAELIPVNRWGTLGVIPVEMKGGNLSLAMKDPRDNKVFDLLSTSGKAMNYLAYAIDAEGFDKIIKQVSSPTGGGKRGMVEQQTNAKDELPPDDVLELLRECEMFARFPNETLQQLKENLPPIEVKKGALLAKPGDQPGMAYLVWKGSLQVSRPIAGSKATAPIFKLGSGDTVGEVALLANKPIIHFIRATEDTMVIPLPQELISQLLGSSAFTLPLAQHLCRRLSLLGNLSGVQYFSFPGVMNFAPLKRLVPYTMMMEYQVIPLGLNDNEVLLGLMGSDHNSVTALIHRYLSEYRVKVVSITDQQYRSWLSQFASMKDGSTGEIPAKGGPAAPMMNGDPVAVVNDILLRGMAIRASDIHFEPFEEDMTIRYRVDGVLSESPLRVAASMAHEIVSRIKVMADMDVSTRNAPQDGQLKATIKDQAVLARASVLPVKYGEKVVLRLIRGKNALIPLNMLCPDRRSIQLLQTVARAPYGLFLVTGPTGSGKTTTLYSLLGEMNKVDVNITTIEDPIEMEIPGTNQVEIDRKKGLDFAKCLPTVLRQDPDVVMIGEIRDNESARIVFDAAITGHVVLSTLHTNNSMDVVHRLKDLAITAPTLSAGLLGVLNQRLVRGVCRSCASTRPTTPAEAKTIKATFPKQEVPTEMAFGRGCPTCAHTGYMDRVPVFEMWRNTTEMNSALARGAEVTELIAIARKDGFETLFEFGVKMALIGLTTIDEVKRNISHD